MFRIKLQEPKPLLWWYKQRDKVDTEPSYQRRSNLWSPSKQAFLIDTILNDYDMPKLYLADFTSANTGLNENRKPYAVIDGKQRLEAIYSFFEGELKLNRNIKYLPDPDIMIGGMNYFDLKSRYPGLAGKFEAYIPTMMSVVTDEEGKIEEIFLRLNTGVHVSGAERRNAMKGIVPIIIRRLVEHEFFITKIRFDVLRMADFNAAAKILLIEHKGEFADTRAGNLDKLVKSGIAGKSGKKVDEAPFLSAENRANKVLNQMSEVFDTQDTLLSSAGPIPLYYWFVKHNFEHKDSIRAFLEEFVESVRRNEDIVRKDPQEGDPELAHYYTMARTTNEGRSLEARYKILQKRFAQFLRRKKRSTRA